MNNELRRKAIANGTPRPVDTPEQAEGGLLRDDSDRVSRVISNISNDSIRQLMKIASFGFEEDFGLNDIDLADICESWDTPLSPVMDETPIDLQREVDVMRQQICQDFDSEIGMPGYDEEMQLDEQTFDPMTSYEYLADPSSMGLPAGTETLPDRQFTASMEQKLMPEMDVNRPRVNLVLDSQVVRLDSRFCPKPSVTILPSQVIHAPEMQSSPNVQHTGPSLQNWQSQQGAYDWSVEQQQRQLSGMQAYGECPNPSLGYQPGMQTTLTGEFSRMMTEDDEQHPFMAARPRGLGANTQFTHVPMFQPPDISIEGGPRAGKVVRKNTKGEKIPAGCNTVGPIDETESQMPELVAQTLSQNLPESRSAEIRKIQSMTEADICNYVKTMAPQLQDNAWEEIVRETNFQERLDKARMKMQEHAQEMGRIRREVETGRIDAKTGHELMRKVYNRREAAASRTKREQGLVKAAVKKRTLEKICSWMREHLFGSSELFSTNSMDSDVRRSRSDGTASRI